MFFGHMATPHAAAVPHRICTSGRIELSSELHV